MIHNSNVSLNYAWEWSKTDHRTSDRSAQPAKQLITIGELDRSWYQGRGVFGGFTAALILDAMIQLEPQRPPRSFTVFCSAPALAGPARLVTQLEQRGNKVSHLSARLYGSQATSSIDNQNEPSSLVVFAGASFGHDRNLSFSVSAEPAPPAPPSFRKAPTRGPGLRRTHPFPG